MLMKASNKQEWEQSHNKKHDYEHVFREFRTHIDANADLRKLTTALQLQKTDQVQLCLCKIS